MLVAMFPGNPGVQLTLKTGKFLLRQMQLKGVSVYHDSKEDE